MSAYKVYKYKVYFLVLRVLGKQNEDELTSRKSSNMAIFSTWLTDLDKCTYMNCHSRNHDMEIRQCPPLTIRASPQNYL